MGGRAWKVLAYCTKPSVLAGLLVDLLERQAHLAARVEAQKLDLDLVALLDHVGHLLHPLGGQFGDVDEAVAGAEEVHEGAEVDDLDHRALVDLADFRLRHDRLDPVLRRLDRLARRRRDLDQCRRR
jgi:hypothetical protein